MFNLFKKEEKGEVLVETNQYPQELLEIHNEFEIAGEKLIEGANKILKEAETKDVKKVDRLLKLGFKQANNVKETTDILQKAETSKEIRELVNYYRREYPFNKFITQEQVKAICFKYNLICGEVGIYKGFVPEKNLREIENFKLKSKERDSFSAISYKRFSSTPESSSNIFLNFENAEATKFKNYYHIFKKGNVGYRNYAFQSEDGIEFYGTDGNDMFGLQKYGTMYFRLETKLQICAPVKDMDLTGMDIRDGYKVMKHIPDPIVLQPVRGGYLVVTKWGNEAKDEIVQNPIEN